MRLLHRLIVTMAVISLLAMPALPQNAVADWNNTAVKTIVSTPSTAGITPTAGMTGIYLAYMNLAIFDTLNAIHPEFRGYGGIQPYAAPGSSDAAPTKNI